MWFIGLLLLATLGPDAAQTLEVAAGADSDANQYGIIAMHILMAAYFAHLLARTIYLTLKSRSVVRISC